MSRGDVYTATNSLTGWRPTHIELADWADIVLVAPATASSIRKLSNGLAEGLFAETFLALPIGIPNFIALAMNGYMLHQPSVQRNLTRLAEDSFKIITPIVDELACGYEGDGKIAQSVDIVR